MSYLSQKAAQAIDVELMSTLGFSIDQLMELAGLSVASAVHHAFPPHTHSRVLVVCGSGNNGGDALVAARHMAHFGYQPTVWYPKHTDNELYLKLITQCKSLNIHIHEQQDAPAQDISKSFDFVLDGIFGFSFDPSGGVRAPYRPILSLLRSVDTILPIASIDVPSGWHVENGDTHGIGVRPQLLVSLTAPKNCARHFKGTHYLGGRFVPPAILDKYNLALPAYSGSAQFCVFPSDSADQEKDSKSSL